MKRNYAPVPQNIERKHILQAIAELDAKGVPDSRKSTTYGVFHAGKVYPPPLVVGIANQFANGEELGGPERAIKGGRGTACFALLERLEFEIRPLAEDPSGLELKGPANIEFAKEKLLEDFMVEHWERTPFGLEYELLKSEQGACIGQQYRTDTGPIDLLALSKDKRRFLVIELKKSEAKSDAIGQILRYMDYIAQEEANDDQTVEGAIIATQRHLGLERAMNQVPGLSFYQYNVVIERLA